MSLSGDGFAFVLRCSLGFIVGLKGVRWEVFLLWSFDVVEGKTGVVQAVNKGSNAGKDLCGDIV